MKKLFILFMFGLLTITNLHSKIINVPTTQYPTIQSGIDAATEGDTVLVDVGTYYESIDFNGKNIVVGSLFLTTDDISYISNTVINGRDDHAGWPGVNFTGGEDLTAVLTGFTITLFESWYDGGGIYCERSGPSLMNLIIRGNTADAGGGIGCRESSYPNLVNVLIEGNTSTYGGGAFNGGGICCIDSKMNLINVTISRNIAHGASTGGIFCRDSEITLINTILWKDFQNEIWVRDSGSLNALYSDIQGGWPGVGNMNVEPMFADTTNGDYRLLEGSPCIDAGILDTMIVYNNGQDTLIVPPIDYIGAAPDIGAYEFDPIVVIPAHIEEEILKVFSLGQNYPNPFNPSTTIKFTLPKTEEVKIEVFNLLGRKVTTLLNNQRPIGYHEVVFDATGLPTGVYVYKIIAGNFSAVKKCLLLK